MKPTILPDFLKTQNGNCLSIYLPRLEGADLMSNKIYLEHVKAEVSELLRWSADAAKREYFRVSIERLMEIPEICKNRSTHVAVFITEDGRWDFRFSGYCPPFFSLASSFHIKPLVRFFHRNRKFFFLHFGADRASLLVNGPDQPRLVDAIIYSEEMVRNLDEYANLERVAKRRAKKLFRKFVQFMSDWISRDLVNEHAPLLVCGEDILARPFRRDSSYEGMVLEEFSSSISNDPKAYYLDAKEFIQSLAKEDEEQGIAVYRQQFGEEIVSSSLPLIARQAVQDNVELLLISKEEHVWGEFNRSTGNVRVHFEQLSDRDDDLLDDVAEVCLSHGVKVLVLEKSRMPTPRPIAAVFRSHPKTAEEEKVSALSSEGDETHFGDSVSAS